MSPSNGHALRRSSRVPVSLPVHVTSPDAEFSEVCETLVVSAHGCALRLPIKLEAGSVLRLHNRDGRETKAYVVFCQPMGSDGYGWKLGARLDRPENFWGLESYPEDWRIPQEGKILSAGPVSIQSPQARTGASREILEKIEEQLSEDRLRGILTRLVKPMQGELDELRQKLSREAHRNRFEVSLGQIPPELEEKLWERLRQDVGTRVLQQIREQSAEAFGTARAAIEQKVSEATAEFRHRLTGELHSVEQRAQALSRDLSANTQQQVNAGIDKLRRQASESRDQVKTQAEELAGSLQRRLTEAHEVHRREVENVQAEMSARASGLQSQVTGLTQKIESLNESVRKLESDLDAHLERLAGEIITGARVQLEGAVVLAMKELQKNSSNELDTRLDELCGKMRTIQNRIENSFSGSLESQGEETLLATGRHFEELAEQSMEKWRLALAQELNSVAKMLGERLGQGMESGPEPN